MQRWNDRGLPTDFSPSVDFSTGFFQCNSRMASGSLMPRGMSLIYVLARFFSFRPYTARSRSFCVTLSALVNAFFHSRYVPGEESDVRQDIDHNRFVGASATHLMNTGLRPTLIMHIQ